MGEELRKEQITEAFEDLEAVFRDPDLYDDCSVRDCTVSLASEFVGKWDYPAVVTRLEDLATAEEAGNLRVAQRHLDTVRNKLAGRGWLVDI